MVAVLTEQAGNLYGDFFSRRNFMAFWRTLVKIHSHISIKKIGFSAKIEKTITPTQKRGREREGEREKLVEGCLCGIGGRTKRY